MLVPLLLFLGTSLASDDDVTPVWNVPFATTLDANASQVDTAFAGTLAVGVGELSVGFGAGIQTRTYLRGWERSTGVERWKSTFEESEALGVTTNATGTTVIGVLRNPSDGNADGSERLVVLNGSDGAVLFEDVRTVLAADTFRNSDVDGLKLSPSGLTLYRLEFSPVPEELRLTALETSDGSERWSIEFPAQNAFEFFDVAGGQLSLAVAPDSSRVYVTYLEEPTFDDADVAVGCYSSIDGAELWTTRTGTVDRFDRCSPPFALADGSGVVYARWFLPTTSGSLVEKLSAVDGTSVWTASSTLINPVVGFSPVTSRLAVAATLDNFTSPAGANQRIECFDTAAGSFAWGSTQDAFGSIESPIRVTFDPTGDDLYVLTAMRDVNFAQVQSVLVESLDAATGSSQWFEPLHANDPSTSRLGYWLDAPSAGGAAGGWSLDTGPEGGLVRTALADSLGSTQWSFETADELPSNLSPVGRVFADVDGTSVWTWPLVVGPTFRALGLRLERRALDDGHLIEAFEIPNTSLSSTEFEVSFSPFTPHVALVVPIPGTFDEQLVLRDLRTGVESAVPIGALGFGSQPAFAWTPGGTRLYAAIGGGNGRLVAIDLASTTVAWTSTFTPPLHPLFGGSAAPLGLVVDPLTNDPIVSWFGQRDFGLPSDALVAKFRYLATDGATVWDNFTAAEDLVVGDYDFVATTDFASTPTFSARHFGLQLTEGGGTLAFVGGIQAGLVVRALVQSLDPATGDALWTRVAALDLGLSGRTVDAAISRDGLRLHVLSEGQGDAHLVTFDAQSGALLWERFLGVDVDSVRGLVSVGEGLRLVIGVTRGAVQPAGALTLAFDAETGEELWRLEDMGADAELCEFLVTKDGALVTVGESPNGGELTGFARADLLTTLQDGTLGLSVGSGGSYPLHLDFDDGDSGDAFLILGSSTGTSPTTPFVGLDLPLVVDAFTITTLVDANFGLFQNTLGFLDASGDARAAIVVPAGLADPALVGASLSFAGLRYDFGTGGFQAVTQSVSTVLLP